MARVMIRCTCSCTAEAIYSSKLSPEKRPGFFPVFSSFFFKVRICKIYGGDGCVSAAARLPWAQPSLHVTAPFEHKYMSVCESGDTPHVPPCTWNYAHWCTTEAGRRFACRRTPGIMKEIKKYIFIYHIGCILWVLTCVLRPPRPPPHPRPQPPSPE